jgi:hypothetical protein
MAADRRRLHRGRGDVDVPAWSQAVQANGGTVTAQRLMLVSGFIAAEKAAGNWQATDDYWALWAENEGQALTSLKQRRLATLVGAASFTADRGYAFDGVASYINSGFIQAGHTTTSSGLNMRLGVYERTTTLSSNIAIGATTVANAGARLNPRNASSVLSVIMNGTSTASLATVPTSAGWTTTYKAAANSFGFYKNGVLLETYDPATETTGLNTQPLYIGGSNANGTLSLPRACSIGFACFGAALSAPQEAAQYTNIQAWATALGAAA